ncbi:hypothetical protein EV644_104170 [Kribbella orskensis]|uniref:Uncharacterized protein n=1 Tax=Kribbella orskensis TaxID=2512216 RepID=A0ABY2BNJ0_9ACTN|nr:hypothetical protein EV642_103170 [Kribbella sp. VKM Ac-2500]TCO25666.1 hypothetical protein EV644_104170 [Kribbella orskensis]
MRTSYWLMSLRLEAPGPFTYEGCCLWEMGVR